MPMKVWGFPCCKASLFLRMLVRPVPRQYVLTVALEILPAGQANISAILRRFWPESASERAYYKEKMGTHITSLNNVG